ncbi:pentapeptide repeat-containing protein [uncultured Microscilla sp.]|uniref:pentapeptide repeat-containing protein n=1 Tax=uncultured Microscilla sp. TaxID=432653 RepID=UPI002630476F|nr:pentapeptide repeat-containing protein [uncultured Microscilla sp.]
MKKVLQYFLFFAGCLGWALPIPAQQMFDYSKREYTHDFKLDVLISYNIPDQEILYKDQLRVLNQTLKAQSTIFLGAFTAKKIKFEKPVDLSNATFSKNANFYEARFDSVVNFSNANFQDLAIFEAVSFRDTVDFSKAVFQKKLLLSDASFAKVATFSGAQLPQHTLLVNVKIKNGAVLDFRKVKQAKILYKIDIRKADVQSMIFDYTKFQIYFDSEYAASELDDYTYMRQAYQQLIKQQEKYGFEAGYHKALTEYKAWKSSIQGYLDGTGETEEKKYKSVLEFFESTNFWKSFWLFTILIIIYVLGIKHRKTIMRAGRTSSALPTPTIPTSPLSPSKTVVLEDEIVQNVKQGTQLWQTYPPDSSDQQADFWTQYERLVRKAKNQR